MDRYGLKRELDKVGVKPWYYNIDGYGETDQKLCLQKEVGKWKVCFFERGKAYNVRYFSTEDEACVYMLKELT